MEALANRLNTALRMSDGPIVLTGGGSGGHITPLLAIADELKKLSPATKLIYIGQKGDKLQDIPAAHQSIDEIFLIRAGKFRRYHGEGIKQLFNAPMQLKNVRDFFYTFAGTWQAYRLLGKLKPKVVFSKGGFTGLPVGLATAMHHIPFVTHDSDAVPGLANRLTSRWTAAHAVALPKQVYKYKQSKTFTVGVPIASKFLPITKTEQAVFKQKLGLKTSQPMLFITGGGNGAQRLNEAIVKIAPELLKTHPRLVIYHASGRAHEQATRQLYDQLVSNSSERKRVVVKGFFIDLYLYSGAADLVISRAGATNIAEFAAQGKACVLIPNPQLTGGQQLKNAKYLADQDAVAIFKDEDLSHNLSELIKLINVLLDDNSKRQALSTKLSKFAKPRAAKDLAELILDSKK